MVMKGSSSRATTTDRKVWLNSSAEKFLLTVKYKEAFQLTFSKSWFTIPHNTAMCLTCNFRSPCHNFNLFIILDGSRLGKNIMHEFSISLSIWTNTLILFFLCYHSIQARITIDSLVEEDGVRLIVFEVLLNLVGVVDFVDGGVFGFEFFLAKRSHPYLIKVIKFWHKEHYLLIDKINSTIGIHLGHTKEVVEECFLVLWIRNIA